MDKGQFKALEDEEENESDFFELKLSSSSSSHSSLKPNSPSPLWLQSTLFPLSSYSLLNPDFHSCCPIMQNLASPDTIFSPSSSSSTPALLQPTTQPHHLNPNPSQRRVLALQPPPIIPQNPDHLPGYETIPVPFPWATDRRAMLKSLTCLKNNQILTITGTVHCKTCDIIYEIGFDLKSKFAEVLTFIAMNKDNMYDRAPKVWMSPRLPICKNCGSSIRPIVSEHKRSINWLFLFLGQMLGCCTLEQLKYYCKHTRCFRTGAKDRILYITYLGICEQLEPSSTLASDI